MRMQGHYKAVFMLFFIVSIFATGSFAIAAPPFLKGKAEPPELPGVHILQRFAPPLMISAFAPKISAWPRTVNVLFLKVDFSADTDAQTTGDGTWTDPVYAYGSPPDPEHWVSRAMTVFPDYWREVSYGDLTVNVAVFPAAPGTAYRLPQPMSSYGSESTAAIQNLIYDSVTAADSDIDFNNYDAIMIIHAGAGEETDIAGGTGDTPRDIWSLSYGASCISLNASGSPCLTVDGRQITEAIIMPQTDVQDGIHVDPGGVFLHEFGHWLGLPDLYCTSLICFTDGAGDWSLMASGNYNADPALCPDAFGKCIYGSAPAHLDAWSKIYMGWVAPLAPAASSDPGSMSLDPVEKNRTIIKLQASTDAAAQYFLLENRQTGPLPGIANYDRGLSGSGMLLWLIDEQVVNANLASNTVNNNFLRPGVRLIEADGDNALRNTSDHDLGSSGDPFPGSTNNQAATPLTTPSTLPYTQYGWVNIRNISEAAMVVSFEAGFAPLPPQGIALTGTTLNWSASTSPDAWRYAIYKNGVYFGLSDTLSFSDDTAVDGDSFTVTALDTKGNESVVSSAVVKQQPAATGGGGGCFIATAAYGSYLHGDVKVLRDFRDRYLLTSSAGRVFVNLYYRYSPSLAKFIARHEALRAITRACLTPIVYSLKYPIILLSCIIAATSIILTRRRRRSALAA